MRLGLGLGLGGVLAPAHLDCVENLDQFAALKILDRGECGIRALRGRKLPRRQGGHHNTSSQHGRVHAASPSLRGSRVRTNVDQTYARRRSVSKPDTSGCPRPERQSQLAPSCPAYPPVHCPKRARAERWCTIAIDGQRSRDADDRRDRFATSRAVASGCCLARVR